MRVASLSRPSKTPEGRKERLLEERENRRVMRRFVRMERRKKEERRKTV